MGSKSTRRKRKRKRPIHLATSLPSNFGISMEL
jgi:hypothetical protein